MYFILNSAVVVNNNTLVFELTNYKYCIIFFHQPIMSIKHMNSKIRQGNTYLFIIFIFLYTFLITIMRVYYFFF